MLEIIASLYERMVLRRPWLVLAALAVLASGLQPGLARFKLDASTDALLLDSDLALREYRQIVGRYQVRDFLFVAVVPPGDILAPDTLALISEVRDAIAALPAVKDVISILDVPLLSTFEGRFEEVAFNFETLRSRNIDPREARDELTGSPIYRDLVASADGEVTAMQVFLEDHPELPRLARLRDELLYQRVHGGLSQRQEQELARLEPDYERAKEEAEASNHAAIAEIRAILDRHRGTTAFHLGGLPMILDDMLTFIQNDLVVFGAAVVAFLLVMLGLVFREPRWVCVPFASCIYATFAMCALLGILGWKVTVISSNFVSLMLILTMSMNVHLIVRYRELARDRPEAEQYDLVRDTMFDMGRPVLYTVLTNIIGFVSFVSCDIVPVVDFGWMMTIGLAIAFVATFTLFPALLVLLPKRPPGRPEGEGYAVTGLLGRLTERHGRAVLGASAALAVVAAAGIARLDVENSFISYFHDDTEIHRGLALVDRRLGGTTPLDVVLDFPPEAGDEVVADAGGDLAAMFDEVQAHEARARTWFSDARVARIEAVHAYLESQPEIGKVLSLASTLRVAEQMNGGRPLTALERDSMYRQLPEAVQVNLITPFVSVPDDQARISARVYDSRPDLRRDELLSRIRRDLHERLGLAPEEFRVAGLLVLYNNVLQSLYRSQILTVGTAILCIMIPLAVFFGSLRVALIGILPNALAAACVLGFMGWAGIPLDLMTITIAAITIGIAVEDCIHYLYSYRRELTRLRDPLATMHYCHANIAKAGFYTTVIVTVGFSILVLSNFIPTILFGVLTAIAMIIALLGALTLLPRLLLLVRPFDAEA